jgi:hypothetical protein
VKQERADAGEENRTGEGSEINCHFKVLEGRPLSRKAGATGTALAGYGSSYNAPSRQEEGWRYPAVMAPGPLTKWCITGPPAYGIE